MDRTSRFCFSFQLSFGHVVRAFADFEGDCGIVESLFCFL